MAAPIYGRVARALGWTAFGVMLSGFLLIIIVPALLGGMALNSPPPDDGAWATRSFDRTVWLAYPHGRNVDNPRGGMALDLKRQLLQSRPTRDEVLALLGADDGYAFYSKQTTPEELEHLLSYNVGPVISALDDDSIDIHFDESDRVSDIKFVLH